jgi:hypothetical protein
MDSAPSITAAGPDRGDHDTSLERERLVLLDRVPEFDPGSRRYPQMRRGSWNSAEMAVIRALDVHGVLFAVDRESAPTARAQHGG